MNTINRLTAGGRRPAPLDLAAYKRSLSRRTGISLAAGAITGAAAFSVDWNSTLSVLTATFGMATFAFGARWVWAAARDPHPSRLVRVLEYIRQALANEDSSPSAAAR